MSQFFWIQIQSYWWDARVAWPCCWQKWQLFTCLIACLWVNWFHGQFYCCSQEEARKVLKRIRGHDDIEEEFKEVKKAESKKQAGEKIMSVCPFQHSASFSPVLFKYNHMRHERRLRCRCVISWIVFRSHMRPSLAADCALNTKQTKTASLAACLPACLSVYLFACLPPCLPVCPFACLPASLPAGLSVCLSVCLSTCIPVYHPVCTAN